MIIVPGFETPKETTQDNGYQGSGYRGTYHNVRIASYRFIYPCSGRESN